MQTFFRVEGPFYRVMMKVWCLLVLNLLMLLTSLPIITIGAAQTAGFTVTTRMISSDETQIVSTFFASFRKNLKQSTITWLLLMVVSGVLVTNWLYLINFQLLNNWMTIGVLIVTLFVANSCQYVFFYLARYQNSLKEMIQNLVKISIKYPFRSLLLLIVSILPIGLMVSPYLFVSGMYLGIFIGISVWHFLRTYLLLAIFKKFE
ncbi:YesL family protein [Enterococcus saccharolyticus]|uniref:Integral membrane protein n=1 Tax=Candidatus Enterococcus willemsii TaxID=1857215 RepID=A0ABQ6Z1H9_9ENTE|nr:MULTISPECIES: YesL family protein [Enterococcus]KAF1305323.1 hypothetical protein BAU17_13145 [Enterococcus sp. CU12B]MCD5002985.1 YesL family protein [Enterococcus saccharolyticus]